MKLLLALFICLPPLASPLEPDPIIGRWHGTLTYQKGLQTETLELTDFFVNDKLEVDGKQMLFEKINLYHVFHGSVVKTESGYELREVLFRYEQNDALGRLDGPITVTGSAEARVITERTVPKEKKGLTFRDIRGHDRSTHTDCPATLKLEITKPGG